MRKGKSFPFLLAHSLSLSFFRFFFAQNVGTKAREDDDGFGHDGVGLENMISFVRGLWYTERNVCRARVFESI